MGFVAETFAGVRYSVRSICENMRCHAMRFFTRNRCNLFILNLICGSVRLVAIGCRGRKLTFRVRCIQPGSATSPLCKQRLTGPGQPSQTAGISPWSTIRSDPFLRIDHADCNSICTKPQMSISHGHAARRVLPRLRCSGSRQRTECPASQHL